MKKVLVSIATVAMFFSGCANDGLALNSSVGKTEAYKYFETGRVLSTKKVIVNDKEIAVLTGASIGAVSGAVVNKKSGTGAIVGSLVGGLAGAIIGKEVVAYQTKIKAKSDGRVIVAYLKAKLPVGTVVEFVDRGDKITNVDVIKIKRGGKK